MITMGIARPQAQLTIKHMDAHGNVLRRKRRGFLGRLGLTKLDIQIVHGKVTDAFVALLTDTLVDNSDGIKNFKYHDSGTGVDAEATGDTTLGTACGEARDTGNQGEGAANIYKSVATHTYAGTFAITEHGLFNAAADGTLMDRTKFDQVSVVEDEKVEFTYQLTNTSGG